MNDHYWFRKRRRPVAPLPRCRVCGGEGLLELAPAKDGRWACPTCRFDIELRQKEAKP